MKLTTIIIAVSFSSLALISCEKQSSHDDHAGHGHAEEAHGGHDDHAGHGHGHDDHSGHDHPTTLLGPNGGKVLIGVSPNAEFFVTADRKVKITFLSKDLKAIAAEGQTVSLISGDRSFPTTLEFVKEASGHSMISTASLPEGKSLPTIVTFKDSPDAKPIYAKFTLDLSQCPTCPNLEYVCTCAHH